MQNTIYGAMSGKDAPIEKTAPMLAASQASTSKTRSCFICESEFLQVLQRIAAGLEKQNELAIEPVCAIDSFSGNMQ